MFYSNCLYYTHIGIEIEIIFKPFQIMILQATGYFSDSNYIWRTNRKMNPSLQNLLETALHSAY
jgi:hypothetical protein